MTRKGPPPARLGQAQHGRPLAGLRGPFKGFSKLKVLDFTKLLPGPYAGEVLAELGMSVTKLELPHFPDEARHWPLFAFLNRRKKQLSLDFRKPAGLEKVRGLIKKADVLLEGFRPGTMERIGLGPKEALKLNPRLVYCSLVGYPPEGPWRRKAGHDLNFLSVSGYLGLTSAQPPTQFADLAGSQAAVSAILAALLERQGTRRGRHVTVAMSEAVHSLLPIPLSDLGTPAPHWWDGSHPFYRVYECADERRLAVAALEKSFSLSLLDALGLAELKPLVDDVDANREELTSELAAKFGSANADEWMNRLREKDVCVCPVVRLEDASSFQDWLRTP